MISVQIWAYLIPIKFYVKVQMSPEVNFVSVRQEASFFQVTNKAPQRKIICGRKE